MTIHRLGPIVAFALLVFSTGFLLGIHLSPLNHTIAIGFGSAAALPVVMAYLAAEQRW
jgi:hypothetical protein